MKPAFFKY